jgi:hypothetical protein
MTLVNADFWTDAVSSELLPSDDDDEVDRKRAGEVLLDACFDRCCCCCCPCKYLEDVIVTSNLWK